MSQPEARTSAPALQRAMVCMQKEDYAAAEGILRESLTEFPDDATLLHLMGMTLAQQDRREAAEPYLERSIALMPGQALMRMNYGRLLVLLGRDGEAAASFREAARLRPELAEAHLELGNVLQRLRQDAEALESFEAAQALAPASTGLDAMRASLLQNLNRNNDALAALEKVLEREPQNLKSHYDYNSLLYRLGHTDRFLASFDKVAPSRDLIMVKAGLARKVERNQEAHDLYAGLLADNGDDPEILAAMSGVLAKLDRVEEGFRVLEKALKLRPDHPHYLGHMAAMLIRMGDGAAAAEMAQQAMALEPLNQSNIALLSTAWRLMGDERDEDLAGYDDLIRVFELDAPKGWRDMAAFNADLLSELDRIHPDTREHLDQSLRFGTQTQGSLFGAGHKLVQALQQRFTEAVTNYVRELPRGPDHPYAKRRTQDFRFAGSWSSRLKDCGYHTDHIHPGGWISSCYYVALPEAVRDESAKQGWIKFGQPLMRPQMPARRAIQPVEGRLILFPSYMWHGTIPFSSQTARTTIAFDVLPS